MLCVSVKVLSLLLLVLAVTSCLAQPQFGEPGDEGHSNDAYVYHEDVDDACLKRNIDKMVRSGALSAEEPEATQQLFAHCSQDFLDNHPLSAEVQRIVNRWVDTDLASAKESDYLELYDRMLSSKPPHFDHKFKQDCNYMGDKYDFFADQVHSLGSIIVETQRPDAKVLQYQRELLIYSLYTLGCRSILQAASDLPKHQLRGEVY